MHDDGRVGGSRWLAGAVPGAAIEAMGPPARQTQSMGRAPPPERIVYMRNPRLPGIEVLAAAGTRRLFRTFHTTYAVCTILGGVGKVEWDYRQRRHAAAAGGLMVMEPGEAHVTRAISGWGTIRVLFVDADLLQTAFAGPPADGTPIHLTQAHCARPDAFEAFRRFHACAESGAASLLEQQSLLWFAFGRLVDACGDASGLAGESARPRRRPASRRRLEEVRDLLMDRYDDDVRLEELADVAGVGAPHLCTAFGQVFGLPPHRFQIEVRISRAKARLAGGEAVGDVAVRLGFYDQSHFTRHFERSVGVTPGRYARMAGGHDRSLVRR